MGYVCRRCKLPLIEVAPNIWRHCVTLSRQMSGRDDARYWTCGSKPFPVPEKIEMNAKTQWASPQPQSTTPPKKLQGFAAMTPEQRALVASKGGKAAHAKGTTVQWNSETARLASEKSHRERKKKDV
jgi:hypothetical protein